MNEFAQMNIFFVIASIGTVIFVVLGMIFMIYLVKFMRNLKYISDKAKIETDHIGEDLQALRENVRHQGFKIKHAITFITSIFNRSKKGK